jgi:hypothetical protein
MLTDSCMTRSMPASMAASTTAADPSMRTSSFWLQARRLMNRRVGGMADARLTTASWSENAAAKLGRSNSDTATGVAPCPLSLAAFSGVRASAVTS